MKKRLLFVMESLGIGGAEKSLVTLLSQLDYSKYDVDLFLFNQKGEFLDLIPEEVNLLDVPKDFSYFMLNPKQSLKELVKNRKNKLLFNKIFEVSILAFNKFVLNKEYIGWKFIRKSIDTLDKEYDVAIGFLEKKSIYFTVDKVKANKKIGWIHTDYKKIEFNYKLDSYYLDKLNEIRTVSNSCKDSLLDVFSNLENKTLVTSNIISEKLINRMANIKINDFKKEDDEIIICTVGRLTPAKGYDIAIECCEKLVKKGHKFKWIVVGDGSERLKLETMIKEKELEDTFILVGSKSNPYPYIKMCDIYVQPSRWEGFGITVAEAKVLKKPIVVSNIPEFVEQIDDNETGLVYKNKNDMVKKIEELIMYKSKRQKLIDNLHNINMNNDYELNKLEKIFN